MPERRTTIRDIALAAGVHYTTVSRALKNHRWIAPETSERIHKLAKEMGYVPDAMLSALTVYRSQIRPEHYQATLGWITNAFTRSGWSDCGTFELYYQGAKERAESLGYKLEQFWLREPGVTSKRNSEILLARGITGLVLAPQPRPKMRVRLDWQNFSAVALGYTTADPHLNTVTNDQFHSMVDVVRQVRSRGYRQIGVIMLEEADKRINHQWSGGFLSQQQFWPQKNRLPILFARDWNPAPVKEWIEQYKPEVIISFHPMLRVIEKAGFRVPGDIAFATFNIEDFNDVHKCCGNTENAA